MSLCSFTTATSGANAGNNQISPQFGQGIYTGIYYPGSAQKVISSIGHFASPTLACEHVIQNDTNFISIGEPFDLLITLAILSLFVLLGAAVVLWNEKVLPLIKQFFERY